MFKDLGMLGADRADLIYFLGTGRCDHGVIYTAMQDAIRNHVNPYMTISFDCASPFPCPVRHGPGPWPPVYCISAWLNSALANWGRGNLRRTTYGFVVLHAP